MPQAEVRSTTWKRVGVETQEAEGHRVHAQKDLVADAWRFVAVRKGDGINPCKPLGTHDTAAQARAQCEADVYEFHWAEVTRELDDKLRHNGGPDLFERHAERQAYEDQKAIDRVNRPKKKRVKKQ